MPPPRIAAMAARLREFLQLVGESPEEVSRALGHDPDWLSPVLAGRAECPVSVLEYLARRLDLNADWLLLGRGSPRRSDLTAAAQARPLVIAAADEVRERMEAIGNRADEYACAPLLRDDADVDPTRPLSLDAIESYCIIYKKWLAAPGATVCLRLRDASMAPVLNPGSIVAVNRSRRGPAGLNGKLVAVRPPQAGRVLVRRVIMDDKHLAFAPENPDYDPRTGEPRNPVFVVERRPHRGAPAPPNPIVGKIDWAWSLFP